MVRPAKAKAVERLQKALDKIPELKRIPFNSPEFEKWHRDTRIAIVNTFGNKSDHEKDFNDISFSVWAITTRTPDSEFQAAYVKGLDSAASILESMIGEIEEYWEEDKKSPKTSETGVKIPKDTNRVFVVHGHDDAARETAARFLEKLDLEPVILREQPNKGRTIIEKFEEIAADIRFAVVLLTPDDEGARAGKADDLKPRARQNVILELGFFLGRLGRERVCPLVKGDVETPSDYDGVVYTRLDDADGWKIKLFNELKAAGFDIDANRAFGP